MSMLIAGAVLLPLGLILTSLVSARASHAAVRLTPRHRIAHADMHT